MTRLAFALTGDQWIALAGVAAGIVGTVGGLLFGYFNGYRGLSSEGDKVLIRPGLEFEIVAIHELPGDAQEAWTVRRL